MSKKALVEQREPDDLYPSGWRIVAVHEEDDTYKVKPPLSWKKCPDGTTIHSSYDGKTFKGT